MPAPHMIAPVRTRSADALPVRDGARVSRGALVVAGMTLSLLPGPTALPAQAVSWIGRLGTDTAVVESVRRSDSILTGVIVNVAAGLVVQRYEVDLDRRGGVTGLRVWTMTDGLSPGTDDQPDVSVDIGSDSIRVTRRRGGESAVSAVATLPGAVPILDAFFNNPMALMDLAVRQSAARGDRMIRLYYVSAGQAVELPVETVGPTVIAYPYVMAQRFPMLAGARLMATVDSGGLSRFDATQTTFKIITDRAPWTDAIAIARRFKERGLGAGGLATMSPPRSAAGRIGAVEVKVDYGQPSRRGRQIFRDVVPPGRVWRAGANAATRVSFSGDVLVGGRTVPAGSYSLWVLPGERTDTLILNKTARTWGVMYDSAQDLVRVPLRRELLEEPVESLTYSISGDGEQGVLGLAWDDRRLSAEIRVGPAVDAGDLYVANIGSNEITVYDGITGAFKGVFVAAGAGGLTGATGIAFGPDGHLYVGSSQTNQVLRYDGGSGSFLGAFVDDSALVSPFSLIFGPDGHLYVSSGTGNVVRRYDGHTGDFMNVAASDSVLRQPIGLAFGPDRMLYVVNSAGRSVMRFDPTTGRGVVVVADSLGFPSDIAFGPDGALYVSNASTGTVARFDPRTGRFRDIYARLPARSAPMGLAFAPDGRLFVGDFAGSRLFAVPAGGGEPALLSAEGLTRPENITFKPR